MNLVDFVPIYGPTRSISRIARDEDASFTEKCYQSANVGIASGLSTVATVALFGYSHGVVNLVRFAPVILPAFAVVTASAVVSESVVEQYSKFEPENPNEKVSFWQGFGASLAGGFSMGGGIDLS